MNPTGIFGYAHASVDELRNHKGASRKTGYATDGPEARTRDKGPMAAGTPNFGRMLGSGKSSNKAAPSSQKKVLARSKVEPPCRNASNTRVRPSAQLVRPSPCSIRFSTRMGAKPFEELVQGIERFSPERRIRDPADRIKPFEPPHLAFDGPNPIMPRSRPRRRQAFFGLATGRQPAPASSEHERRLRSKLRQHKDQG